MIPQPKQIRDYFHPVEFGAVFEAEGAKWVVKTTVLYVDENSYTCIDVECQEIDSLGFGRRTYFGYLFVFDAIQKYNTSRLRKP